MSEHIMELRKIVGHRPVLQVGAIVIVENEHVEVLLQKRADNHCVRKQKWKNYVSFLLIISQKISPHPFVSLCFVG